MSDQNTQIRPGSSRKNSRVVMVCLAMVIGMGGLAYASVPLYELFCRVTGYGGTPQRADLGDVVPVIDRTMKVRFDANTASSLDWKFGPETREVTVNLGEKVVINYIAENLSDEAVVGMATFNVTPQATGAYFNKIECFCFTDTYIEPGGRLEMPVMFYVDPDLDLEEAARTINTITLSYTFFESETEVDEIAEIRGKTVSANDKL